MRVLGPDYLGENGYYNMYFFQEKDTEDFHSHTFFEIKYIVSGRGYHQVLNGEKQAVGPGDVVFINVGVPHSIMSENASDLLINFNILFSADFAFPEGNEGMGVDFLREVRNMDAFMVYDKNLRMRRTINEMFSEFSAKPEGYLDILALYTRELIFMMLREKKQKKSCAHYGYIAEVLAYIEKNTEREIGVAELADLVHLSPNYFSKLFKKEMGKSPIAYIQGAKVQRVCEWLATTDKTFSECAVDIGYQNESHLRRIFKEVTGQTPKDFKKRTRTEPGS